MTAFSVRIFDTLHITSAIVIQDALDASLPFLSADGRQLSMAHEFKLENFAVLRSSCGPWMNGYDSTPPHVIRDDHRRWHRPPAAVHSSAISGFVERELARKHCQRFDIMAKPPIKVNL